jgi:solute carrier family 25 citrate transporter 1
LALYHGLAPSLLGSIPKAGIRFGLDAWFGELLHDNEGNLSIGMYFFAGLAAGIVEALVIVAPVETIKTKCIELNMSFLRGMEEILVMEGISGIYRGVWATVLKQGSVSLSAAHTYSSSFDFCDNLANSHF